MKRINARGAPLLDDLPQPLPLTADRIAELAEGGALVVDTRPAEQFGEEHIPGAVFAGFGTNFHAWMGWIAPYDRDLVLVLTREAPLRYVVTALHQIGIDRIAGYLEGGMLAWREAGYATAALPRMTVDELAANQRGAGRLPALDVRADDEWNTGHIAGARHMYAGEIAQGASPDGMLDPETPATVICGTGYRSTVAASLLATRGYTNLINVVGGMVAWNDAHLPVTRDANDEETHVRTLDA
jgi:hydroxyacylglutathione hydrolase